MDAATIGAAATAVTTFAGGIFAGARWLWGEHAKRADIDAAERKRDRDELITTLRAQADGSAQRTEMIVRAMADSTTSSAAMAEAVRGITSTVRDLAERVSRLEARSDPGLRDSERIPHAEVPGAR